MTSLIVDASVAAKWFLAEDGWQHARQIEKDYDRLIAPDLVLAEVGNALWKSLRTGRINKIPVDDIARDLRRAFYKTVPADELFPLAFHLSIELNHPIYDCFYLALAEQENAPLITADRRLASIADNMPNVEARLL